MNPRRPILGVFRLFLATAASLPHNADALTLAREGVTKFNIVVAADAIPAEVTAANELRLYLKEITGADFPILTETDAAADAPQIVVGPSQTARNLAPDIDWPALGADTIVIKTSGNKLLLAGGRPRGSLYAVYTFLEETAGCRWWTSTEADIPRRPTLEIPPLDILYSPPLTYREAFYRDPIENPAFAARMKLNGHFYRLPPELGGHFSIIGWCHTFFKWLPPEDHFAAHPTWYSEINGKRTSERSQLCLTNLEMREKMIQVCLEKLREQPEAGILSVSQNDWHGACQCNDCAALDRTEGSPAGTLLHFVNAVAEAIEQEFPEVLIETLAYQYTRKPPLHVRPRKNVVVRLCSIECSFTDPLDGDANAAFRNDLLGWSDIAPNLYIWNYVTNFSNYILPHPNLRVLGPNLRFFAEHNVRAVFEQGDRHTTVGDFVRLRTWLLAHLLWNPSRDEQKLTNEFLHGYYGSAAPHLAAYLGLVHDAAKRANARIGCYNQDTSFLNLADMREATRLFEKALAAVSGHPALTERVRRERLPLDHVWLLRHDALAREAKERGVPFPGPPDPAAAAEEFIRLAGRYGNTGYSEGQAFDAYAPSLRLRFSPPPPPPEDLEKLAGGNAVVIQESEFRLYDEPASARIVADEKASDGKAARMPGQHTEWAVQYHLSKEAARRHAGEWQCYLVVRCEAKTDSGTAFAYGIYDNARKRAILHLNASLDRVRQDRYHTIDLGRQTLRQGMYFWVAPPGNGKAVYVDRIVLVPISE